MYLFITNRNFNWSTQYPITVPSKKNITTADTLWRVEQQTSMYELVNALYWLKVVVTHIIKSPIAIHIPLGNGRGINAINPHSSITENRGKQS